MDLKITSVRVTRREYEGSRVKGYASVTLNDAFAVRGIRIIEGDEGLQLSMPSRKRPNGEYQDMAHPINAETRQMFEDVVFEEYNNTPLEVEENI